MTERLDALMTRPYQQNGETKTSYTKIGVAFPTKNGGFRVKLETLPTASMYDGKVETSFILLPPRERDQNTRPDGRPGNSRFDNPPPADFGDNSDGIPF